MRTSYPYDNTFERFTIKGGIFIQKRFQDSGLTTPITVRDGESSEIMILQDDGTYLASDTIYNGILYGVNSPEFAEESIEVWYSAVHQEMMRVSNYGVIEISNGITYELENNNPREYYPGILVDAQEPISPIVNVYPPWSFFNSSVFTLKISNGDPNSDLVLGFQYGTSWGISFPVNVLGPTDVDILSDTHYVGIPVD